MFTINPRDGKAFSQPVSPKGPKLARCSNVGAFWFTAWVIAGAEKNFCDSSQFGLWKPNASFLRNLKGYGSAILVYQAPEGWRPDKGMWGLPFATVLTWNTCKKNPTKILRPRCTETIHVGFFQAMPKAQKVTSTNWTALPRNMFWTLGHNQRRLRSGFSKVHGIW